MKEIALTQGKFCLVDDEDYVFLSQYNWSYAKSKVDRAIKYQETAITWIDGKNVKMHRLIMNPDRYSVVDHKNGDQLDNRKENLIICSRKQNSMNSSKQQRKIGTSSSYKGVSWNKARKKWESGIQVEGKRMKLGYFDSEIEAAEAYNKAASLYYGEFSKINDLGSK